MARIKPLLAHAQLEDAQLELKQSKRVEKYRVSENALFFPRGFSWLYLPLREIRAYKRVTRLITSDNGVCPFSMEAPGIRIHFGEEADILEIESEKSAETLLGHLQRAGAEMA